MPNLDKDGKKILTVLAGLGKAASNKEIAEKSNLDAKIIAKQMKTLKDQGLVDSPERCKYAATAAGKAQVK